MNSIIEAQHEYYQQNVGIDFNKEQWRLRITSEPQIAMEWKLRDENTELHPYVEKYDRIVKARNQARRIMDAIASIMPQARCAVKPRQ